MTIHPESSGERVDVALARLIPGLSRNAAQRLLSMGLVRRVGESVRKNEKTAHGDVYEVELPSMKETETRPEALPIDVVFEDDDVIVVNKEKGMVVHPAAGHRTGTLVNALLYHCEGSLSGIGGELRPGIVHRIDKDTSGLLIAAKNDVSHQALAAQLKSHMLRRTYECLVVGNVKEDTGTICAPIGRHPTDRKKMAVTDKNSRDAVTHFTVLARYPGYTHLECRLETGRTHQIRVHLAWQNHPIVGDAVYGRKKKELGLDTQCLHARELTFRHPRTGELMTVSAPLPPYFEEALRRLRAKA